MADDAIRWRSWPCWGRGIGGPRRRPIHHDRDGGDDIKHGIGRGRIGGDALHVARAPALDQEAPTEIAAVVAADGSTQRLVGTQPGCGPLVALLENARARLQIGASVEDAFVVEGEASEVGLVDLAEPHAEVEALCVQGLGRGDSLGVRLRLAREAAAYDTDRIRVVSRFRADDGLKRRRMDAGSALLRKRMEVNHVTSPTRARFLKTNKRYNGRSHLSPLPVF